MPSSVFRSSLRLRDEVSAWRRRLRSGFLAMTSTRSSPSYLSVRCSDWSRSSSGTDLSIGANPAWTYHRERCTVLRKSTAEVYHLNKKMTDHAPEEADCGCNHRGHRKETRS